MKKAFTMSEILLSLTIIGVVAAITLPSLTGNINERVWNTQRKALYTRFAQAIPLMPALNGYGILEEGDPNNVALNFITNGLSKVLKINNICDSEHLADCGMPDKVKALNGSMVFSEFPKTLVTYNSVFNASYTDATGDTAVYSQIDTKACAFETANGESVATFYYPLCRPDTQIQHNAQPMMCANFVYDLNGKKGPNTMGKDIGFITIMYPTDSVVVAPMPVKKDIENVSQYDAGRMCRELDSDSRVPNRDELAAMYYNKPLWVIINTFYWSSSVNNIDKEQGCVQKFIPTGGNRYCTRQRNNSIHVRCIK